MEDRPYIEGELRPGETVILEVLPHEHNSRVKETDIVFISRGIRFSSITQAGRDRNPKFLIDTKGVYHTGGIETVELQPQLSPKYQRNLLSYFKKFGIDWSASRMNCFKFVAFITGAIMNSDSFYRLTIGRNVSEQQLEVGSVVACIDERRMAHHIAIYIGEGLYFSKFGLSGPVIVNTLDEMLRGFESTNIVSAMMTPKQESHLGSALQSIF